MPVLPVGVFCGAGGAAAFSHAHMGSLILRPVLEEVVLATAEAVVTAEEEEQEVLVVVAAAGRVVEGAVVLSHDHLERRVFGPVLEEVLMLALAEAVIA